MQFDESIGRSYLSLNYLGLSGSIRFGREKGNDPPQNMRNAPHIFKFVFIPRAFNPEILLKTMKCFLSVLFKSVQV